MQSRPISSLGGINADYRRLPKSNQHRNTVKIAWTPSTPNTVFFWFQKQPVEDLPELRVRIWPQPSVDGDLANWTWNWRTVHPGPEVASPQDGPEIRIQFAGGKTEHDTLYGSIAEAADRAISSINVYLENKLPAERRLKEQRALVEQERKYRIQGQVDDFFGQVTSGFASAGMTFLRTSYQLLC